MIIAQLDISYIYDCDVICHLHLILAHLQVAPYSVLHDTRFNRLLRLLHFGINPHNMLDSPDDEGQQCPEHRKDQTSHVPEASSDTPTFADPNHSPLHNLQVSAPYLGDEVDGKRVEKG